MSKQMARKSFFPEIWSKLVLEDFAKDGIMGDFVKPESVGPDWPQYAGIKKNIQEYHSDAQEKAVADKIDDHIMDAISYGLSVVHIHAKS